MEHLKEPLHVLIQVEDSRNRAESRLQFAMKQVKRMLIPAVRIHHPIICALSLSVFLSLSCSVALSLSLSLSLYIYIYIYIYYFHIMYNGSIYVCLFYWQSPSFWMILIYDNTKLLSNVVDTMKVCCPLLLFYPLVL